MCLVYVVEENVQVSLSYVYYKPYFSINWENPHIKTHRKIPREPLVNTSSQVLISLLQHSITMHYVIEFNI